ncbi:thialysine N-epsilon-acetyltransferase-like [Battus philenor]|uniref:thialysine N-epsilon-acetyltransferase-like n=1 Tax=Battus philenor TaxID=42288 RepID=UPI0035CF4FE6
MKTCSENFVIRAATAEDMPAVASMVQELADFQNMSSGPTLTFKDLQRDGFESQWPAFRCVIAEDIKTRVPVGYATYFPTYSTFEGRSVMVNNFYVKKSHRRRGIGRKLFQKIVSEALSSGCRRVDFHVLAWNEARAFYEALGAQNMTDSHGALCYQLTGDALIANARQANFA